MFKIKDKSNKNTDRFVPNSICHRRNNAIIRPGLIDGRMGSKRESILINTREGNSENEMPAQLSPVNDGFYKSGGVHCNKFAIPNGLIQKVHKDIPKPNEDDMGKINSLSQENLKKVREFNWEKKGTHGTNWIHAISIMQGIKSIIPKEERTSEVTPEEGGFFVDISESGTAHSHDFAKMAAYGTQEETDETTVPFDFVDYDNKRKAFEKHVESREGTQRAIVLDIWGPKEAHPEHRGEGLQDDEEIYRTNAHLLVATLKYSL